MLWLSVAIILALTLSGMPLFAGLGSLAVIFTYFKNGPEAMVNLFLDPEGRLTQNDMLLPIIYFTLMGYIIAGSKAPDRLVALFQEGARRLSGNRAFSFGIMAVLVCAFFTPLTGASGVTIVALGGILMPVLQKANYSEKFRLGIITSSGSLGLLFFPSIPIILFGIVSNNKVSIVDLFKAGVAPGILLIFIPSFYVLIKSSKIRVDETKREKGELRKIIVRLVPELLSFPVMYFLFLTGKSAVSEIGLIALFYFFMLEVVFYREIKFSKLPGLVIESMSVVGGIIMIIFFATSFTSFLIDDQIPQALFEWIQQYVHSKWTFLILLNLFLLVVGALMDIFSAVIVTAPLVIPIAESYGLNMIHLGILFITNLEIGYITPPVGMNLFLSAFRFKVPLTEIYRSIYPFIVCLIFAQIIITYFPSLSLFLFN